MSEKRAVIYLRVSTSNRTSTGDGFEQNPEVQEIPLRQMILQRGWTLGDVYSDRMSGAKENRLGLNALMQAARRGEFDAVVVWRFDRFARSIEQLFLALAEFRAHGIDFVSCQEALDTSSPIGQGDVHDHRSHGRAGAERYPRTSRGGYGIRSPPRNQKRKRNQPAEAHLRSWGGASPTRRRHVNREDCLPHVSRRRDGRSGAPGTRKLARSFQKALTQVLRAKPDSKDLLALRNCSITIRFLEGIRLSDPVIPQRV